jgi:hypothetical protein
MSKSVRLTVVEPGVSQIPPFWRTTRDRSVLPRELVIGNE